MRSPGRPSILDKVRGSLPLPVIILIAVLIIGIVVYGVMHHSKSSEVKKTETVQKHETVAKVKTTEQTDSSVTYAAFDTGKRQTAVTRKADRNRRTVIHRKTTRYSPTGVLEAVTEIETTIDDNATSETKAASVEDRTTETTQITAVTETTNQVAETATTESNVNKDSSSVTKESGREGPRLGKAGLAVTSGGHPAITWDVAKVWRYAGQTVIEVDPTKAGIRAAGFGLSKDITRDGRYFAGAHTLYGKEDGIKTGVHIGIRF